MSKAHDGGSGSYTNHMHRQRHSQLLSWVKLGAIGTEPLVPDSSTAAIGENRTSIPPSHLFSTLPPILYPSLVGRVYRRARTGPVAVGTTEGLDTFTGYQP